MIVRANTRKTERTASPTFVSLYANDTEIRTTPWDVRLAFGVIHSIDNDLARITLVGEVHMSPQHAKQIAKILIAQLQSYEAKVGPIPLPKA